jgi:hypothetical protein
LDVTADQHAIIEETRRNSVLLYVQFVIFDSAKRWGVGNFGRTSPLCELHEA